MVVTVASALRHISVLLSLRLLPFVAYYVLSKPAVRSKVAAAAVYAVFPVLACLLGGRGTLLFVAIGWAYYLLVSIGLSRLGALVRTGSMTRGAAFVVIFFVCLFLPGVALPGVAASAFLVVGWELALSAYSYSAEIARPGATEAPLGECLFFLLVNPTVLYTVRGERAPTGDRLRGLLRTGQGIGLLAVEVALLTPLADQFKSASEAARVPGGVILALSLSGATRFLALYAAHSGLASLQIGLMRHAGWIVPERYEYPLTATGPMQFWRRWNIYVRVWLEAYVFLPLVRRLGRSNKAAAPLIAAIATLVASGLLHDGYDLAGRQTFTGAKIALFATAGALLVVWRVADRLGRAMRDGLTEARQAQFDLAARLSGRACLGGALVGAALVWG